MLCTIVKFTLVGYPRSFSYVISTSAVYPFSSWTVLPSYLASVTVALASLTTGSTCFLPPYTLLSPNLYMPFSAVLAKSFLADWYTKSNPPTSVLLTLLFKS